VFLFFISQLVMRIVFSIFYLKYPDTRKQLITYDIGISTMLFIVSFLPFIENIFNQLSNIGLKS
jgi:membrane-associated HD superfamily phosphohydrolase